jgi:predicted transcriptional regulator
MKAEQRKSTRNSVRTVGSPKSRKATRVQPASSVSNARFSPGGEGEPANRWTFLTNHAHVLILLSLEPKQVLREVAMQVGITERAVQRIIADLEEDGFIKREKIGRQNVYHVYPNRQLRHPIEAHRTIGQLIKLINEDR